MTDFENIIYKHSNHNHQFVYYYWNGCDYESISDFLEQTCYDYASGYSTYYTPDETWLVYSINLLGEESPMILMVLPGSSDGDDWE